MSGLPFLKLLPSDWRSEALRSCFIGACESSSSAFHIKAAPRPLSWCMGPCPRQPTRSAAHDRKETTRSEIRDGPPDKRTAAHDGNRGGGSSLECTLTATDYSGGDGTAITGRVLAQTTYIRVNDGREVRIPSSRDG
jgi:hypothetical protein